MYSDFKNPTILYFYILSKIYIRFISEIYKKLTNSMCIFYWIIRRKKIISVIRSEIFKLSILIHLMII